MRFDGLMAGVLFTATLVGSGVASAQTTAQLSGQDKTFIAKAGEGSLKEIQFSQLALQKSNSDDIKGFAQKMVTDHTQLISDMKPFADQAGIPAPTELKPKDKAMYDELNGLSGTAFDKKYISDMVKDHHKDVREFKMEASATTDPNFKSTVENGEKVVHQHMVMIDQIAKNKGVATPASAKTCTSGQ